MYGSGSPTDLKIGDAGRQATRVEGVETSATAQDERVVLSSEAERREAEDARMKKLILAYGAFRRIRRTMKTPTNFVVDPEAKPP
eukprot:jgi/Tetstr1/466324/TSEL_010855.t1